MLKGKEFGAAIGAAIQKKLDSGAARSKAEIARHFGVQPPSISDWVGKGSIEKDRLPELWRYFSDVAGPEHWGMTAAEWPAGLSGGPPGQTFRGAAPISSAWLFDMVDESKVRKLSREQMVSLQTALLIAAAQIGLDIKKKI